MIRFLAQITLILLANAAGIIIATVVLPGFTINAIGFITSVVLFTTVELMFERFAVKVALRYVPALHGGIALVTTFVGLLLTNMWTSGLEIQGVSTWLLAPMIVWLTVVIVGTVLPMVLFKDILQKDEKEDA